jgi:hypothetical protein
VSTVRLRTGLLALLVAVLASCSPGSTRHDVTDVDGGVAAVEAAIPALERARTASAQELDLVLSAAAAVDARDEVGVRGDRTAMRRLVQDKPFSDAQVDAVAKDLLATAQRYVTAADALSAAAAAATLPAAQQRALGEVAKAARAEAVAGKELAKYAGYYWPRYSRLGLLQQKWLTRARGGWYRNQKESADAYVVLTSEARPFVEDARPKVAAAAATRSRAAAGYASAVTAYGKVSAASTG